jgi:hypothetical protein
MTLHIISHRQQSRTVSDTVRRETEGFRIGPERFIGLLVHIFPKSGYKCEPQCQLGSYNVIYSHSFPVEECRISLAVKIQFHTLHFPLSIHLRNTRLILHFHDSENTNAIFGVRRPAVSFVAADDCWVTSCRHL